MKIRITRYAIIFVVLCGCLWLSVVFRYVRIRIEPITSSQPSERTRSNIELTVRMSLKSNKTLHRLFCMYLRSAVVFWNPDYGDVVFILDAADKTKNFENTLLALELPFRTRVAYEEEPGEKFRLPVKEYLKMDIYHAPGYLTMFYSSFLFDYYTSDNSIVAWCDLDVTFTMPVVMESIFHNGRLIVKGDFMFNKGLVRQWAKSTEFALGLPMPSNFMIYFPAYMYASTVRNCREYIVRKFGTRDFKEAFILLLKHGKFISPVNILLSYAYHFERHRYHWHINIGSRPLKPFIKIYNEKVKLIPPLQPLTVSDIRLELHVAVHRGYYYKFTTNPLQQGLCYTQIYLGMKNIPHCEQFMYKPNLQLFMFEDDSRFLTTWCGRERRHVCEMMIGERYKVFVERYKRNQIKRINTTKIDVVERVARGGFNVKCPKVTYVPFH